ncbi:hypothetical protein [Cupriavidus yeoncheonensis]|nr:hypothetical protein [Cupriavidus yeoncheonensis]
MTKLKALGTPVRIAILGYVLLVTAFYPGFMSPDSLVQYSISKTLEFNDWHPPIMSWVWSMLDVYVDGPQGLLLFQLGLFWLGLYAWYQKYSDKRYSWIILGVGFLPWIVNFSGVLWKDVEMAYALLLAMGLIIQKKTRARMVVALILVFYAINLRYNALFAAIPIVALMLRQWFDRTSKYGIAALAMALLVVLIALGNVLNYKVLRAVKSSPSTYMMVDDLSYLSMKRGRSLIPGIPMDDIRDCASQEVGENKLVGRDFCLSRKESYSRSDLYSSRTRDVWRREVVEDPFSYLWFRLSAFSYLLRSSSMEPFYIWHPGIDENKMGIRQAQNGLTVAVEWYVKSSAAAISFFFKPYFWLLLSLALLWVTFLSAKTASTAVVRALLISALLYILGYVPATPMADFRYVYWAVLATSVAFSVMVTETAYVRSWKFTKLNMLFGVLIVAVVLLVSNSDRFFFVDWEKMTSNPIGAKG